MKTQFTKPAVVLSRVRNYRSGDHIPYPGILHDITTDERIDWTDNIGKILRRLPEGSRVSIDVTYELPEEGDIDPDDYWELTEPHTYGPHCK